MTACLPHLRAPRATRTAFALFAAVVVGSAVVAPGAAAGTPSVTAAAAAADDVVLVGHGWGHGRGLGQYGAYGYVVDHGWKHTTVLNHFYRGTSMGSVDDGSPVTVRLASIEPGTDSWVTSAKAFVVGGYSVAAGSAARVVWNTASSSWRLQTKYGGCATGAVAWDTSARTQTAAPAGTGATAADALVVCRNGRGYLGSLRWVRDGSVTRLVNSVPLRTYLRGVLPSEVPASWADARHGWGLEAVKAQAVAARSYVMARQTYSYARTCDTTSCQVYGGFTLNGRPVTDSRTDRAVTATAGQVRVGANGAVALTEFSSSTGGYTAGGAFTAVRDDGDVHSPNRDWTVRIPGSTIASTYAVGTFRQLKVVSTNQLGGSGRVVAVDVVGTTRTVRVSGASFRSAMGLRSDWFYPAVQPLQQATGVRYVRLAHSPAVYRVFSAPDGSWTDHAWVDAADYAASGRPPVTVLRPTVRAYSWSPTRYAVYQWPDRPTPQVDVLTEDQGRALGSPAPSTSGVIYGTLWYRNGSDLAIWAEAPDPASEAHHVTPAEWSAAGRPAPVVR